MMQKLFLASLISLSLAACATTGGMPSSTNESPVVQQVQQITQIACKFVPTAGTILQIVAQGVPGLGAAEAIADAICAAVAPTRTMKISTTDMPELIFVANKTPKKPTVAGVPVRGKFVR